jgi:hypothetical protein
MIFRLLAGHGSVSERESEALVEAVFGGLRRPQYRRPARPKPDARPDAAVPKPR